MNLTIDGSIGAEQTIKTVIYRITTAESLLPAGKTQGKKSATQNHADQPGFVVGTKENRLRCLDDAKYDVQGSVVVDLAARRSGGRVATLLPVQIVLRFHSLFGFISLAWLRLVKCVEGNA